MKNTFPFNPYGMSLSLTHIYISERELWKPFFFLRLAVTRVFYIGGANGNAKTSQLDFYYRFIIKFFGLRKREIEDKKTRSTSFRCLHNCIYLFIKENQMVALMMYNIRISFEQITKKKKRNSLTNTNYIDQKLYPNIEIGK